MANSPVMNLSASDLSSAPAHYTKDLETERVLNTWRDSYDVMMGLLTGGLCETFHVSGAFATTLGQTYGGLRYNDGSPKIITAVTLQVTNSGSGGVTRCDVRKGAGALTADESIFSNNVFKPILSASAGAGGVGRTTTIVPASASWARGEALGVFVEAAAGAAAGGTATDFATDLVARVWWKPSASYAS